jgi:hypothetical protein
MQNSSNIKVQAVRIQESKNSLNYKQYYFKQVGTDKPQKISRNEFIDLCEDWTNTVLPPIQKDLV